MCDFCSRYANYIAMNWYDSRTVDRLRRELRIHQQKIHPAVVEYERMSKWFNVFDLIGGSN